MPTHYEFLERKIKEYEQDLELISQTKIKFNLIEANIIYNNALATIRRFLALEIHSEKTSLKVIHLTEKATEKVEDDQWKKEVGKSLINVNYEIIRKGDKIYSTKESKLLTINHVKELFLINEAKDMIYLGRSCQ